MFLHYASSDNVQLVDRNNQLYSLLSPRLCKRFYQGSEAVGQGHQ